MGLFLGDPRHFTLSDAPTQPIKGREMDAKTEIRDSCNRKHCEH